jgi:hypothetical protein
MTLGAILATLHDEGAADTALAALDDIVLYAQVQACGAQHGESPGEYTCGAVRRFSNLASGEDWLSLMTAIEKSSDPARTTLDKMVRWSLLQDANPGNDVCAAGSCNCG